MLRTLRATSTAIFGLKWKRAATGWGGVAWSHVPQAPPDPILGVNSAFLKDERKDRKVNLGIGAYRDANGSPFVLECIKRAEHRLVTTIKPGHEYLPIGGYEKFNKGVKSLMFGPDETPANQYYNHSNVSTVQTISGTGALRIAADFLAKFHRTPAGARPIVYLPNPTWGNHKGIFSAIPNVQQSLSPTLAITSTGGGFAEQRSYRYFDPRTGGVDIAGLLADMKAAEFGSIFLFHACAHNPTGADPTIAEWRKIADAARERELVIVFDNAYQGFASGDPERDVASIRLFAQEASKRRGAPYILVCQSFAKNMGLYGERVGALSILCSSPDEATRVRSQLCQIIRPMYSSPPAWGARLAAEVLTDSELTQLWKKDLRSMSGRITEMRGQLVAALKDAGSTRNWDFIKSQIGMFSYTGLTRSQCQAMTQDHAIYLTMDGRISMAGLNNSNVGKVAKAIHNVTLDA